MPRPSQDEVGVEDVSGIRVALWVARATQTLKADGSAKTDTMSNVVQRVQRVIRRS